jgi:myosin-crossreactive antigen
LDAFTLTQSKPDGSKTKKVNWKKVWIVGGGVTVASLAIFLIVKSLK